MCPLYFHLINHTELKTLNHDNSLNGNLSVSTLKNNYENEIDSILDKQDTQSQRYIDHVLLKSPFSLTTELREFTTNCGKRSYKTQQLVYDFVAVLINK